MHGPSGDPTVAVVPLQTDVTVAITAVVTVALAGSIAFLLYLAFGPHNQLLEDEVSPAGEAQSAVEDPDPAEVEERKDVSEGQAEPGAGETDGTSSPRSDGPGSGSPESG